jgi:hypothetical protein
LRSYGAIIFVALYTVCVVTPSNALAFPSGSAPSHCLSDDDHGLPKAQVQAGTHIPALGDNAITKHADNSMKGGGGKLKCHAGACCGVSCFAAIASDPAATIVPPEQASLSFGALDERPEGLGSKRIGRPPKSF